MMLFISVVMCDCVILGQLQWFSAGWRTQVASPKLAYFEKERIPLRSEPYKLHLASSNTGMQVCADYA